MKKRGFTLAEVLITLAIIGVVAAISIPSVISNSQQQEFKTGLRKAVSVLNSAITMNMALDGETPYDNSNLFGYLMKHMSVMRSTTDIRAYFSVEYEQGAGPWNSAFYTTDGMRFEFDDETNKSQLANIERAGLLKLHESDKSACFASIRSKNEGDLVACGGVGIIGCWVKPQKKKKENLFTLKKTANKNTFKIYCLFSCANTLLATIKHYNIAY